METATAANPERAHRVARLGRGLTAVGDVGVAATVYPVALLIVVHGVVWLLERTDVWTSPPEWELGRILSTVIRGGMAAVVIAVVVGLVGRDLRHDGEQLAELEIRVGPDGIAWSGYRPGSVTWAELAHVVVTANRPGRRRLRLAGHRRPEKASAAGAPRSWPWSPPRRGWPEPPPVKISTFWDFWRRAYDRDVYLLDAPIDRLSVPARQLVAAIESYSNGRFPDRYDPSQFGRAEQPPPRAEERT